MIMAGVIARVSILKKERARSQIPINKSAYIIKEFDKTFDPAKHNLYLVRRAEYLKKRGIQEQTQKQHVVIQDTELMLDQMVGTDFEIRT